MTKLEDGPAKGQVLMLRRAPLFLRVAESAEGWDGLDLFDDSPEPGIFYAYRRTGTHGSAFIDFGGKKKHQSGLYTSASYEYIPEQPTQDVMASNEAWQTWCLAKKAVTP